MKNIYLHQHLSIRKPAAAIKVFLLLLFLSLTPLLKAAYITGTFTTLPDCPVTLNAMCVDPATGFLYALGNANDSTYYKYNISTSTWSVLASAPHKTDNNAGATLLNGKIYISYTQFPDLAVYTIATDTWSTITGPSYYDPNNVDTTGGTYTGNISNDGTNIYICGNHDVNIFYKYVISTGSWVSLATLDWGGDNAWGGLCYNNGYFYHDAGDNAYTFDRYLVATNSWETLPNIPNSDGAVLGAAIYDAYYYCMGGYNGTNLYSYDLGAQEWNNTLTLPWMIDDATICVYQGSLYIIHGEAGIGFTKFTPTNPMLTNIEPALLRYTFGAAAIQITNTLTASQNLGTNLQSATVSVASNFESGKDVLSFVNAYGLTGSWSSATGVLTLTGSATIANYQAALRTVKYFNSNATSSGLRRIEFQVYDGTVFSNIAGRNLAFPGPAVTTNPITNINATSATSGGNVIDDGGSAITAHGICWNTTGTPTIANTKTSDGTGTGSFTSAMTGLTNGTTYHVRAYATSSVAPGKVATLTAYGEERTFIAAEFYVNAGPDASTCGSDYFLSGVAGGAYTVDITSWSTTGDGYFNDDYALQTTYYAGTNDLSTGFTTLTLNATFPDPASTTVSDEMTLSFTTSVGGAVTGETTVCTGTNSTLLTLVGSLGVIQKWQYSTNDTTWSDISTATTATYTATNLTDSTWFRALVKNGATCNVANSDPALISIEQPAVTGTLAKTPDVATVFAGTDVSAVLTPGTGGAGTDALNYRTKTGTTWGSFMEYISGTAISTTGKTGVSIRTWREAIACDPDSQVAVEWAVESKPSAGAIAANQTICYNTTPAAFTSTAAGIGTGTISYEWQTNATGSYVTITGDTLATYQAPALTATTSYQRRTVATVSGTKYYSDYTTAVTITVRTQFTTGEIAGTGQTICTSTSPTTAIGNTTPASGGDATITYSWRWSVDNYATAISGAILATYTPAGPLTATTSYRRYAKDNTCNTTPAVSTGTWTVTVEQTPISGTLAKTPDVMNVCQGGNVSAVLTAGSAGNGTDSTYCRTHNGTSWAAWTAYTSGANVSTTGKTSVEIRTKRKANSCSDAVFNTVSWAIEQTPVSGTLAKTPNTSSVCVSTSVSAALTAGSGGNATDSTYYRTYDGTLWAAWTAYVSGTSITTTGKTSVEIRTKRKASYCSDATWNTVSWTVNPTSNGGNVSGGGSVCYGTNSTLLSLAGQTGSVVKWQYTINSGTNWNDITNTNATYTATNLITTTSYRAVVQSGVCDATPGGYANVTVRPVFTAGSIKKSGETICYNLNPALIGDSIAASGGDAAIEYQWQSSLNAGFTGTPTDIATNAASYDPPTGLTATTWYRRQAKEGTCNTTFTTSAQVWKVTVRPVFTAGSIKKSGETICYNGNPALIGDSIAASGGDASIAYQWQSSLNVGFTGTPTDIATNAASYDPPTGLTATTWYRRQAKDATCNLTFTSSAQVWKVTVNPASNGGNISGGAIVCYGTNSTLLSLYGQTGSVVKWQYTSDGGYNWYDIANTNATYTATNLIATTSFRAVVQSGVCSATPGGYANVTVRPVFTAGSIKKAGETICYNGDPAQIGDSIAASGGDAAIEYQWQSSLDAGFTGIPTDIATSAASYNPPENLTATTWYRRQAKEGTCNTNYTSSAQVWKVTVRPVFTAGSIKKSGETICYNGDPALIGDSIAASGGDAAIEYQWQSSTNAGFTGTPTNIATNAASYNPPAKLTTNTWYRRQAKDGLCNAAFTSSACVWKVSIEAIPPVAQAKNITKYLDVSGNATIAATDIDNGSTDNCSIATWVASKTTFNCSNLGPNSVILTVTDSAGNSATATSVVTVAEGTALPSPFVSSLIGNSFGTATYSPCNLRYTLTSKGYSSPNADVHESVYQPLTGNGSIVLRVVSITGGGWAGVQIRESNAPGAKKVLLKTQFQTMIRSEIRLSTGGAHSSTQISRQGIKWLKLQRVGNRFDAYTSVDGIGWRSAFSTSFTMAATVQFGFFTESLNNTVITQARFDKVVVTTGSAKLTEAEGLTASPDKPGYAIELFPNPAREFVTVEIPDIKAKVVVSVYSAEGRMLHSETITQTLTQLDVSYLKPGIYILRFDTEGEVVTRRLVVY